jgi:hypothetical protein
MGDPDEGGRVERAAASAQVTPSGVMRTLPKDGAAIPRSEERPCRVVRGRVGDDRLGGWTAGRMCEALCSRRRRNVYAPAGDLVVALARHCRRRQNDGRRRAVVERRPRLSTIRREPEAGLARADAVLRRRVAIDKGALGRRLLDEQRRRQQPPRAADDDQGYRQTRCEDGTCPHLIAKHMALLRRRVVMRQPRPIIFRPRASIGRPKD